MKFSILALGAAVAGISTECLAQLQIESSFTPRSAEARLVSQNQDFFGTFNSPQPDPPAGEENSDYYAESNPQAEISGQPAPVSQQTQPEKPVTTNAAPATDAATDRAVKKVTTGAPLEVLAMTPEVGMVPVCWDNSGCVTPNPVANYMMINWCTNGLWDTYPAYRARQCAKIQQQLYGHNRYTCGCASCGNAGVVAGQAGCNSCAASPSQCAQNVRPGEARLTEAQSQSLLASSPAITSPYAGELQAGLPALNLPVAPQGYAQLSNGIPDVQLTTTRLPNGPPVLQLPTDVPTVPYGTAPHDAGVPGVQLPQLPSVLPALPLPVANPVVASRPTASLR
ncbi:MAG: hypothetical protein IT423_12790 [Pirellulaceae bacterium]|nr:hypothetical protein [Pirellulaceae bacterium]